MMKEEYRSPAPQSGWLYTLGGRILLWGCVLAVAAVIFGFSAQSGPASSSVSNAMAEFIIRMVDPDFFGREAVEQAGVMSFVKKLVRKGAHFSEFAALGFFIRLLAASYRLKHPTSLSWAAGTIYAGTDEIHQLFVSSRACMWQDVLLDSSGVLAGITVAYALMVLSGRLRRRLSRRHFPKA